MKQKKGECYWCHLSGSRHPSLVPSQVVYAFAKAGPLPFTSCRQVNTVPITSSSDWCMNLLLDNGDSNWSVSELRHYHNLCFLPTGMVSKQKSQMEEKSKSSAWRTGLVAPALLPRVRANLPVEYGPRCCGHCEPIHGEHVCLARWAGTPPGTTIPGFHGLLPILPRRRFHCDRTLHRRHQISTRNPYSWVRLSPNFFLITFCDS